LVEHIFEIARDKYIFAERPDFKLLADLLLSVHCSPGINILLNENITTLPK
jgi:hypothetical protein